MYVKQEHENNNFNIMKIVISNFLRRNFLPKPIRIWRTCENVCHVFFTVQVELFQKLFATFVRHHVGKNYQSLEYFSDKK